MCTGHSSSTILSCCPATSDTPSRFARRLNTHARRRFRFRDVADAKSRQRAFAVTTLHLRWYRGRNAIWQAHRHLAPPDARVPARGGRVRGPREPAWRRHRHVPERDSAAPDDPSGRHRLGRHARGARLRVDRAQAAGRIAARTRRALRGRHGRRRAGRPERSEPRVPRRPCTRDLGPDPAPARRGGRRPRSAAPPRPPRASPPPWVAAPSTRWAASR